MTYAQRVALRVSVVLLVVAGALLAAAWQAGARRPACSRIELWT